MQLSDTTLDVVLGTFPCMSIAKPLYMIAELISYWNVVSVTSLFFHFLLITSPSSSILTGCKNCTNVCKAVFTIEEDFGRARVYSQSGNHDLIQQAIDSWYDFAL